MSYKSESDLLILHTLRIKGFTQSFGIAETTGLSAEEVEERLNSFQEENLVSYREGRIEGWMLTQQGREQSQELISAELESSGQQQQIDSSYQSFLSVNKTFLSLCTDWQLRTIEGEQEINDHTDEAYDAEVINRLTKINTVIQPVCEALSNCLDRFESYGRRFSYAVEKVQEGEHEWFTKPMIDSYHTVWFELHENLLSTLGIERSKEVDENDKE